MNRIEFVDQARALLFKRLGHDLDHLTQMQACRAMVEAQDLLESCASADGDLDVHVVKKTALRIEQNLGMALSRLKRLTSPSLEVLAPLINEGMGAMNELACLVTDEAPPTEAPADWAD